MRDVIRYLLFSYTTKIKRYAADEERPTFMNKHRHHHHQQFNTMCCCAYINNQFFDPQKMPKSLLVKTFCFAKLYSCESDDDRYVDGVAAVEILVVDFLRRSAER